MNEIAVLDQLTIDKIAAGEVIERPASIVKELVENAIDAGANAVTVEIKDGGVSFIRITDNGMGIEARQVPTAFLRHATSKIRAVDDLLDVASLGFRGEALSSIAAVCQVELITKTADSLTGVRYLIEGGKEKGMEEIGAPAGTTFLVRNIFYNTPARKKFLKTAQTEAGYVSDIVERLALSHPEVSFKFIANSQTKLHTSGNHNLKDIVYNIYGRDIAANLIEVSAKAEGVSVYGFIGKPVISRGNRNYENYFVNGRYIRSGILSKAIEDAYHAFLMKHRYPFTVLLFAMDGKDLDINVHPAKLELRFADNERLYQTVYDIVAGALSGRELIAEVSAGKEEAPQKPAREWKPDLPEPFEKMRRAQKTAGAQAERKTLDAQAAHRSADMPPQGGADAQTERRPAGTQAVHRPAEMQLQSGADAQAKHKTANILPQGGAAGKTADTLPQSGTVGTLPERKAQDFAGRKPAALRQVTGMQGASNDLLKERPAYDAAPAPAPVKETPDRPRQMELFESPLLAKESAREHRIIGQVFDTYWLVQFQDKLFIIDQHAAHEKVLYERTMKSLASREFTSQNLDPPIVLTLSMAEEDVLRRFRDRFSAIGFEIEEFGGREYALRAVPDNLFGLAEEDLFLEMLDSLAAQTDVLKTELIDEKIASMSCKAAVKGNTRMSVQEMHALIGELMTLDNPYNCPHGRPTIISMSKYELEKKFKRIV